MRAVGQEVEEMVEERRPRVSVIIIFLNPGNYIAEAIQSVVAQTLVDWELILVDDGSSDESTAIAKHWEKRFPARVKCLEHLGHANLGMSASRNRGLKEARGDYVAFLDADDVYVPERLARHVSILDEHPSIDAVQSDQTYWYCWQDRRGRPLEEQCRRPPLFLGDAIIRPPEGLLMLFGVPDAFTAPSSLTLRRMSALELGGFEDEFRSLYEDQVFLTKLYAHKVVYAHQAYLAKYRLHAGGAVSTAVANVRGVRSAFFESTRRLRDWQATYLGEQLNQHHVVRQLLEEHRRRAGDPVNAQLQTITLVGRRMLNVLMRTILPLSLYRILLHRRQQWSVNRTRRQYVEMCRRLSATRLASRGRA